MRLPSLESVDYSLYQAILGESKRQHNHIELIASENTVSKAVLEATGSILTNKYAEGYPCKRYYNGCEFVDMVETLALVRVCQLFSCQFANVQPHSGSQANQAVFLALLNPNDTILGMSLSSGGHLTHGSKVNMSGKWFRSVSYDVNESTHLIDLDHVRTIAKRESPMLIIAGGSSYSRIIDFEGMRSIADEVGAYLMVDMAHFAGLVAGGVYPSPFPHAHVVTSTTHKTLRGPRGGLILTNDEIIFKKINSALFPGIQGGPLMHVIAGKAVCFFEALQADFKTYAAQIVENMKAMVDVFLNRGVPVISNGSDSHLCVLNTYKREMTGNKACDLLESINITCNKNTIPFDELPPTTTSGVRIGTPAITTRGFKQDECKQVASWICDAILEKKLPPLRDVKKLCDAFPLA